MPKRLPSYPKRAHSTGQARISIRGRDVWLGKFGSPESYAKFAKILAELQAGAIIAPIDGEPVTCAELILSFYEWAEKRYVKNGEPTSEIDNYGLALAPVLELYADTCVNVPGDPSEEFGPLALIACRDWLRDEAGYCRDKINQHISRIRRVWKWGVSRQIVRESSWTALTAVEGFRKGEALDRPKVKPVDLDRVNAIKEHVLPPIWAMIQLQLWTGMRPGEACMIRTRDIIRDDQALPSIVRNLCWTYTPESHKTEHHGRDRLILLGPKAQQIIEPWLKWGDLDAHVFSPAEAVAFSRKRKVAGAQTHRRNYTPNEGTGCAGDRYNTDSYGTAIERGCEKAFDMPREWRLNRTKSYKKLTDEQRAEIRSKAAKWREEHCWTPNQLRHVAATLIRKEYGIEIASIILGHASLNTTEVYAEADLEKAARAMAEFG